jgi:hypothetical protein
VKTFDFAGPAHRDSVLMSHFVKLVANGERAERTQIKQDMPVLSRLYVGVGDSCSVIGALGLRRRPNHVFSHANRITLLTLINTAGIQNP